MKLTNDDRYELMNKYIDLMDRYYTTGEEVYKKEADKVDKLLYPQPVKEPKMNIDTLIQIFIDGGVEVLDD